MPHTNGGFYKLQKLCAKPKPSGHAHHLSCLYSTSVLFYSSGHSPSIYVSTVKVSTISAVMSEK